MRNNKKFKQLLFLLLALTLCLVVLNLSLGTSSFKNLSPENDLLKKVIIELRLPRVITAFFVGGALGVCGLLLQTFFRNPLAGPSVLGITSGASLGVAVAVLGTGFLPFISEYSKEAVTIGAIGGAAGVMLIISSVATFAKNTATLLIVGLMLSFFISAFVSLLSLHAPSASIKDFTIWGMGSFSAISLQKELFFLGVFTLVLTVYSWRQSSQLNVLLTGETYAKSMGVNIKKNRLEIMVITSVLVGLVTAFCGPIAFLGLATPHLVRLVFNSSDHYHLIPLTFLSGSVVALSADLIVKMPTADYNIPLNSVLSLIGAPVVIYLILKKNSYLNL